MVSASMAQAGDIKNACHDLPIIRMSIVTLVVSRLKDMGLNVESAMARTQIETALLSLPHTTIHLKTFASFLEDVALRNNRPLVGFELGLITRPDEIGPLGLLFLLARTLREGMIAYNDFFPAVQSHSRLHLSENAELARISYCIDHAGSWPRRQDTEFTLGTIVALLKARFGAHWVPSGIEFEHTSIDGSAKLKRLLGCDFTYGCTTNSVLFPKKYLDMRMGTANDVLISVLKDHLKSLVGQSEETNSVEAATIDAIEFCVEIGQPCMACVAKRLDVSVRTLQRRLQSAGHSFRSLLDHYRNLTATRLEELGALKRDAIATHLGYAESTSLSRSRRRWKAALKDKYQYIQSEGV
ncbi:putative HTH-type transcriptional regulator [Komagataeibacter europaeus]|nr:putative HTH-type transcriptional regulator [Komagataeibacter europaeus]